VYGLNVGELVLAGLLKMLGWALAALAVLMAIRPSWLGGASPALAAVAAALLFLSAGGVRQNRGALALGRLLLLLLAAGALISGVRSSDAAAVAMGATLLLAWIVVRLVWRQAIRLRFKPRFFSVRQFETMVQIADVMLEGEGHLALNPVQVAVNADHLLSEITSPALKDIKFVMRILEWIAPLLAFYPVPFSLLGTNGRRRIIERVVYGRGPFRDVARSLKLLACAGYYFAPEGMASVGYVPFDDRIHATGRDRTPKTYPLPRVDA
jgi:hypothetical protein